MSISPESTVSRKVYEPPASFNDLETLAARVALHIRQSLQLEEILATSVQEVRDLLDTDRVLIYQFHADHPGSVVVESVTPPWRPIIGERIEDNCFESLWHIPFSKGLALATNDMSQLVEKKDACYLNMMTNLQVRANVVAPIMQDDHLWGLFIAHHCRDARQWTDSEVRLLQQLGIQLGIALQQAELYKQLQDQNRELEGANQRLAVVLQREKDLSDLKSNFLSLTSHEFRTPMTTIRSSTELLEGFPCTEEERALLFHQIHNAVDYMVKMLDDIRFMSRRPEEQKQLNCKPLNVRSMIEQIFVSLRSSLGCQHECSCQGDDVPEFLALDEKLTRQILENLISNAMKYSSAKYPVTVNLSWQPQKGLWIQVSDRGMGIPEAEQSHVYETFYRAKNVAGMKGTGLGLAIVKRCVELYGGTIELSSKVNEGSIFTVHLPPSDQIHI